MLPSGDVPFSKSLLFVEGAPSTAEGLFRPDTEASAVAAENTTVHSHGSQLQGVLCTSGTSVNCAVLYLMQSVRCLAEVWMLVQWWIHTVLAEEGQL